jgi:hypothetical protein
LARAAVSRSAAAANAVPNTARGRAPPMPPADRMRGPATIRESADRGVFIENQALRVVSTAEEALQAIADASAERAVATTRMNAQSSRSHAVIQLHLVELANPSAVGLHLAGAGAAAKPLSTVAGKSGARGGILKRCVINLVDLAGSERVKSTGAEGEQLDRRNQPVRDAGGGDPQHPPLRQPRP